MKPVLQRVLTAKTEREKLTALLVAWKKVRHPRIAELIDAVSAQLVRAAGPVVAVSVPERVKQCIALVRSNDALELGRVLATDWPGTWQQALPLVHALAKVDDPRVAAEFARQVDRGHYASLASRKLWMPVFRRLVGLKDTRQLAVLQAQTSRSKGQSWRTTVQSLEATALQRLAALEAPVLSAADEAALAQLEAPHARDAKLTEDGAKLLSAVYANPDDVSLRAVYADWLTEHGDPRGEFISLQLSPPSRTSEVRMRALHKKHWRTWMGPLADWCCNATGQRASLPPTFRGGFAWAMNVGLAQYDAEDRLRALFERPEWRTVEVLEGWPSSWVPLAEALAHPNFARVRRLNFFLDAPEVTRLAELEPTPRLESLQLYSQAASLEVLSRFSALERVVLRGPRDLGLLERQLPRLEEIAFDGFGAREAVDASTWERLEASGVLRVELGAVRVSRPRDSKHFVELMIGEPHQLHAALASLPKTLERFSSDQPELEGEDDELRKALRHFPSLDLTTLRTKPKPQRATEKFAVIEFTAGKPFDDVERLSWLLALLADEFEAEFNATSIDFAAAQPLPAAPRDVFSSWLKNKRASSLRLLQRRKPPEVQLRKDIAFVSLKLPLTEVERFVGAAKKLVEGAEAQHVRVAFTELKKNDWKPITNALRSL
ncbi:MAG: TIGR02996 domain-containing protein [Archangium sp.]|nr:TIGR02996 domain-containing protein [Archangium sp.]